MAVALEQVFLEADFHITMMPIEEEGFNLQTINCMSQFYFKKIILKNVNLLSLLLIIIRTWCRVYSFIISDLFVHR